MKQLTAILIGAGGRGTAYAKTMRSMSEKYKIVAVADLLAEKRLDVVDSLTHLGAKCDVKLGDLLEKLGDASLLTEKRALYLLKLGFGLCRFDLGSTFFK